MKTYVDFGKKMYSSILITTLINIFIYSEHLSILHQRH